VAEIETENSWRTEKLFRCACGSDHFLSVIFYDSDPEGYVSLIDGTHCKSLWCRVKSALLVLRTGAAPHFGVEVCLTPENIGDVLQAVTDASKKIGAPA
jgi:hypothetical protein